MRELIERYSSLHFEDVVGRDGPLRAAAGLGHAAELLGDEQAVGVVGKEKVGWLAPAAAAADAAAAAVESVDGHAGRPGGEALAGSAGTGSAARPLSSIVQSIVSDEIARPQLEEALLAQLVARAERASSKHSARGVEEALRAELAVLKPSALRQRAEEAGLHQIDEVSSLSGVAAVGQP
eukprot:COSAG01_NODE_6145_length_3825_cov_7.907944_3_plen_180_part_00